MGSDDDFYGDFQCDNSAWKQIHLSLLYSDGGNIFLGITRVFSFFLIFGLNWYNRRLLRDKAEENVNVIPGLVLPYYFLYIYLYISLSFICGIIDISTKGIPNSSEEYNWIFPIEQGLFHWLYEGLAFFLMRYGAGVKAIQKSLMYSFLWGIITFLFSFFIFSISANTYGQKQDKDKAFTLFLTYQAMLFAFYGLFLIIPSNLIYRRPALQFYAQFNCILYGTTLIVGSLVDADITDAVCPGSVILFILVAFIQPLALFRTFQIDSQYWQGLTPGKGNPLADVWDHVDVRTAETMAERLESFHAEAGNIVPILHFGLLDFDENAQFVAGGFSRVYFGKCKGDKVAFKILFAMELTPQDVQDFYREASLLASLKHENVVSCKGICVMPPALTMVLEHCLYGSLYDFLYKPVKVERKDSIISSTTSSISNISSRVFSFFSRFVPGGPSGGQSEASARNQPTHSEVVAGNPLHPVVGEEDAPLPVTKKGIPTTGTSSSGSPLDISKVSKTNNHLTSNSSNINDSRGSTSSGGGSSNSPDHTKASNKRLSSSNHSNSNSSSSNRPSSTNLTPTASYAANNFNASGNIELDQFPKANHRPSTFDIEEANLDPDYSVPPPSTVDRGSMFGLERGSFLQRTVDRISGMFGVTRASTATNQNNPDRESFLEVSVAHTVDLVTRLRMMRDAVSGIAHMHAKGFMHCDIKSLNFLVDENYRVKVADMGEVRPIGAYLAYQLPPIPARNWAPPEVITPGAKPEHYTTASEVYGLTIVLCELITIELPFGDLPERVTPPQWFEKLVVENLRPALPLTLYPDLRDVLTRGMSSGPENRPLTGDLLDAIDDSINYYSNHDVNSI